MDSRIFLLLLLLFPLESFCFHVILGSNHKTGSALLTRMVEGFRRTRCLHDVEGIRSFAETSVRHDTRYVMMIRNPFEMIVSGYLYHKRGPEQWTRQPIPKNPDEHRRGHHLIRTESVRYKLPEVQPKESYAAYLTRVDLRMGILAEMVRAGFKNLPALVASATLSSDPHVVMSICLDDLMKSQAEFETRMDLVYRFLDLDDMCVESMRRYMHPEGPDFPHSHGTQDAVPRTERAHMVTMAREFDLEFFNRTIHVMESRVGCK